MKPKSRRAWNSTLSAPTAPLKRGTKGLRSSGKIKPKKRKASEFARIYGSKKRVAWVKTLGCIVTKAGMHGGQIENAHVENGGVGRKANANRIVPLCAFHHAQLHNFGAETFQRGYELDLHAEADLISAHAKAKGFPE